MRRKVRRGKSKVGKEVEARGGVTKGIGGRKERAERRRMEDREIEKGKGGMRTEKESNGGWRKREARWEDRTERQGKKWGWGN